jgi:transcriptional regulator with XRE-family HTH domain
MGSQAAEPRSLAAEACREARVAEEVSQAELARRCGVAPSVVARWESGRYALLESTIERYAAALGKRVRYVLEDT